MSEEVLSQEETEIIPFALQFIEIIPQANSVEISGQYNDKLQVWEYGNGKLSDSFPVATRVGAERPPTMCTLMTYVGPRIVPDHVPDD